MHCQNLPCLAALAVGLLFSSSASADISKHGSMAAKSAPMLAVLDQFADANIPTTGPSEVATERTWPDPTTPAPSWPGNGIAQHPMLYAGEGFNTIFLVNHGKVIWTYSTGKGGEIDDVWMLSNGHVLFARQFHVEEVTPQKEVVWHYDPPAGTEVHSCQPIGLDKVFLVQNALPPKVMVINKKTGAVELEHALPAVSLTDPKTVHPQFRRIRMTATGTYLASFLKMDKVVEYDKDFNAIWTYEIPTPWAAVRLHNGNTLITAERDKLVREVDPNGATVWEFKQADLPPNIILHNLQTADRLANGNTVIFSSTGGSKREDRPTIIQALEVTPDKKLAWVLQDWKNLGPATTAQFLDEPGIPENPGELEH
jgi:outer membrane protein assembly factor BamB